jgi:hypothetical protein
LHGFAVTVFGSNMPDSVLSLNNRISYVFVAA